MNSLRETLTLIGCGDIGQRVAQQIDQNRYQIVGIRRRPPKESSSIHYLAADTTSLDSLGNAMPPHSDVVVVTMTPSERSDEGYRKAYVDSVKNLLEVLKKQAPPRLLLFVSSTSVYAQSGGEWIDEQSVTEPTTFSGSRLLEAEQLIQDSEIPSVMVRFSGIYGPGRYRLLEQVIAGKCDDSETLQYTNRIHSDDCAAIICHLIDYQAQGHTLAPCYIASDSQPVTASSVKSWLGEQLGIADKLTYTNSPNGPYRNKRCRNDLLLKTGYRFRHADYRSGYAELLPPFQQGLGTDTQ